MNPTLKSILTFVAGVLVGALVLYSFLWYQVFHKAMDVWCQIYTGPPTVEMREHCKSN